MRRSTEVPAPIVDRTGGALSRPVAVLWLVLALATVVAGDAHACVCPVDPHATRLRIFPDDGVDVPPNAHFWVFLPRDAKALRAHAFNGDENFNRAICQPGDPLCGFGDAVERSPRTAAGAKHPPVRWPEGPATLSVFLWRWPEGTIRPDAHTAVRTTERPLPQQPEAHEIVPAAPLEIGVRYAIAIGPSAELAFPFAAFHVRGAADTSPPTWEGPQDTVFVSSEKTGLHSCGDGGQLSISLLSLRDASYAGEAAVLFRLEPSWAEPLSTPRPQLAPFPSSRLTLGVERRCVPAELSIPFERPFDVRLTPIDVAGNEGSTYRVAVAQDGTTTVTPAPAAPAAPVTSVSVVQPPASPRGMPPRLRLYGPAILVFIVVYGALRLVWKRHKARSLDRV